MARSIYRPSKLPAPGILWPLGKLTRLESNHGNANELEWRQPQMSAPWAYWSDERQAVYVSLRRPRVLRRGKGCPKGLEASCKRVEDWNWHPQDGWEYAEFAPLCSLETVGSMIAIEYFSNKHDGVWKKHIHRPAGKADIVSVGPSITNQHWIFIKGPRLRATPLGLIY